MKYSQSEKKSTEMFMGIIGPIGCNRELVIDNIVKISKHFSYKVEQIKISSLIKAQMTAEPDDEDQYSKVMALMDEGNNLRKNNDNSILAKLASNEISSRRNLVNSKVIYLIDSLKHPEEVQTLRDIYGNGFYLFAIHSSESQRDEYLEKSCHIIDKDKREKLISRDKDENNGYGQSTSAAFHLADFFLTEEGDNTKIRNSLERYFDLIFGNPFRTPTFQEYSMFMAQAASFRSADLSRQVGAVIALDKDIISSGSNECPKPFGGTYWPHFDSNNNKIYDDEKGRDYMRGLDFNSVEKGKIIKKLKQNIPQESLSILENNIELSGLNELTEFGRVVHAEMDAILACSRIGVSTLNTVMFCTTHPCHNCAKHIVASGIKKVIYIEPYPKSRALEMHDDSITYDNSRPLNKVVFKPFIGVGPRQYMNLFSMSLSIGNKLKRKDSNGRKSEIWNKSNAIPRIKLYPVSYIEIEKSIKNEIDSRFKIGQQDAQ